MTSPSVRTARDLVPDPLCGHAVTRVIPAPVAATWEALYSVRLADLPASAALLALRSLPALLTRRGRAGDLRTRPLLGLMTETRFVVLREEPPRLVTLGIVGQFWKLRGGEDVPIRDSADFVAFAEPGYVKSALDFRLDDIGGPTRIATDTWNVATDPDTARRFERYWRVTGPGSKLIRREMLRAVARRVRANRG